MENPKHFIVVDDDATNNLICSYVIRRLFAEAKITLFSDPEIALENIRDNFGKTASGVTILFLDINMPSMTGWDFLEIFKDFDESIRKQFTIYILSSSLDDRDRAKADANIFVSGFVTKPLSNESIRDIFVKYA